MAEYIEREAAVRMAVEAATEIFDCHTTLPLLKVANKLKTIPTADVVEVVRCKDCMWWYPREYGSVIGRCENPYNGLATEYIEEDEFCSCGKRKEGAEE